MSEEEENDNSETRTEKIRRSPFNSKRPRFEKHVSFKKIRHVEREKCLIVKDPYQRQRVALGLNKALRLWLQSVTRWTILRRLLCAFINNVFIKFANMKIACKNCDQIIYYIPTNLPGLKKPSAHNLGLEYQQNHLNRRTHCLHVFDARFASSKICPTRPCYVLWCFLSTAHLTAISWRSIITEQENPLLHDY